MPTFIFLIVLSVIIIIHEFGHFIAARRCGVKVEIFSLGFGPKIISKKFADTEFRLCWVLFGGYVKMAGDNRDEYKGKPWEYYSQSIFNRMKIIFSGSFLNYVSAFLFLWLVFFFGYPQPKTDPLSTVVGAIVKDYPAEEAGLMVDDEIIKIDNLEINTWVELQGTIEVKKEKAIILTVNRESELIAINITPCAVEIVDHLGEKKKVGRIGIAAKAELEFKSYGIIKSFSLGLKKLLSFTAMTYKSLFYMVTGKIPVKEAVTGVIGIHQITKDVASYGFIPVVHLMAIISMTLAIINLLPFPVLDGGHIVFLALEKIRKKPLNAKVEDIINQTGFFVLIILMVLITFNDFSRYGIWEKIAVLLFDR